MPPDRLGELQDLHLFPFQLKTLSTESGSISFNFRSERKGTDMLSVFNEVGGGICLPRPDCTLSQSYLLGKSLPAMGYRRNFSLIKAPLSSSTCYKRSVVSWGSTKYPLQRITPRRAHGAFPPIAFASTILHSYTKKDLLSETYYWGREGMLQGGISTCPPKG